MRVCWSRSATPYIDACMYVRHAMRMRERTRRLYAVFSTANERTCIAMLGAVRAEMDCDFNLSTVHKGLA